VLLFRLVDLQVVRRDDFVRRARRQQERIEKTTHEWIEEVDRVGKVKEQEILEV